MHPIVHFLARSGIVEDHTASYFSHSDDKASQLREALAEECLESLIAWLKKGGNVAIHGMCENLVQESW
jgi:6-phosphofructo-2-kinase/fructose-2,6-biphosphatase 2